MTRVRRTCRPAYVVIIAIVGVAVIALFALVLARYALLDRSRERQAMLESYAQQVAQSGRAWTRLHGAELARRPVVVLPIEGLLPTGAAGRAELRQVESADGVAMVECRITLRRGRESLRRRVHWPLPDVSTTRPASGPARP